MTTPEAGTVKGLVVRNPTELNHINMFLTCAAQFFVINCFSCCCLLPTAQEHIFNRATSETAAVAPLAELCALMPTHVSGWLDIQHGHNSSIYLYCIIRYLVSEVVKRPSLQYSSSTHILYSPATYSILSYLLLLLINMCAMILCLSPVRPSRGHLDHQRTRSRLPRILGEENRLQAYGAQEMQG